MNKNKNKLRILFFGSSNISLSCLKALKNNERFEIIGVITGEDKSIGRNHSKKIENVVARYATKNNLYLVKSNNINNEIEKINKLEIDYLLTCSFGQYLSNKILNLPLKKALNVHASILPKGRGGAPIHWAIINNELETGITIMEMVEEMDAGDYYGQIKIPISKTETYDSLYEKLSKLIQENIVEQLIAIDENKIKKTAQDQTKVSKWLNIKKEDCHINFSKNLNQIDSQIRGCSFKPKAWINLNGINIKILEFSKIKEKKNNNYKNGQIIEITKSGVKIKVLDGIINLEKIIIEGKKPQFIKDILNGNNVFKLNDVCK